MRSWSWKTKGDGVKSFPSINNARYRKFSTKYKVPEPHKLLPTKDELLLHCQCANYVMCIWKSALCAIYLNPTPERGCWLLTSGILETNWMSPEPAPDLLLEVLSCACKKSGCQNNMYICIANGLKGSDICSCNACTNCIPDESKMTESDKRFFSFSFSLFFTT